MIKLYGSLGKKFPKENKIQVNSAGEAIRAMEANFPGFRDEIKYDGKYIISRGSQLKGSKSIDENEIDMTFDTDTWHILPVPMGYGGKGGFFSLILGAALIATAFFMPAAAAGTAIFTAGGATWGGVLMSTGIGLVLGGIAQMLAPSVPNFDYSNRADERPSYLFNGPVNIGEPGVTIPVVYGESFIGSIFISGSLEVTDI